jgi:hypothetical protein
MPYEKRHEPPAARAIFIKRFLLHLLLSALTVAISLAIGIAGLMHFESVDFHHAFLQAATLLSGLGLSAVPTSAAGKLFVGWYALYSGLVFLVASGIVIAPLIHRLLHLFHWNNKG